MSGNTSGFLTELEVRLIESSWSACTWELIAPLRYRTLVFGVPVIIEAPVGLRTDFASIPRVPIAWWLTKGVMVRPAVIHDFLYGRRIYQRATCDRIFLEAGESLGVARPLRTGMYAAVRVGGGPSYNANKEQAA